MSLPVITLCHPNAPDRPDPFLRSRGLGGALLLALLLSSFEEARQDDHLHQDVPRLRRRV